jgi:aspartyl-tRNA(Asn)/glutamyl-tRNA(Gln) amidotransferase subunit C
MALNSKDIDVAHVAQLARLEIDPATAALFARQIGTIVEYVRKIGELDLAGIEPTSHGQPVVNVFREDAVKPGLSCERAMANAPARLSDEFKVPKIVE